MRLVLEVVSDSVLDPVWELLEVSNSLLLVPVRVVLEVAPEDSVLEPV